MSKPDYTACWQSIKTAPKDGTEIIGCDRYSNVTIYRYVCPADFLTDAELGELDEYNQFADDWFCADFITGSRCDGDLAPVVWMPLADAPSNIHELEAE